MALPTVSDIKALTFGYLNGEDLLKYCPFQFLVKQNTIDEDALQNACNTAYSEVQAELVTRYDLSVELAKTPSPTDMRNQIFVKIVALLAIRNSTSNLGDVPENMKNNYAWLNDTIMGIRNGQLSLIGIKRQETRGVASPAFFKKDSFKTLG